MNELKPEDVMKALECHSLADISTCDDCPYCDISEQGSCGCDMARDALALLREKDAEIKGLVDGWSKDQDRFEKVCAEKDAEIERLTTELQAMRSAANSLKMHYESAQAEIERKNHILESYALQYGTVRDREYFLNKAREEAIAEVLERVLALNTFNKRFFVIGKDEIDRITWDMSKMPKYQSYVRTPQDMRSLYERVKANPSIKQYRGYTATKSYGFDTETQKIIVKEGEFWFDNPSFHGG